MKHFILTALLLFPFQSYAQTHGCVDKCLARGGLPAYCSEKCGLSTQGSVNYPPPNSVQRQQDPLSAILGEVLTQKLGEEQQEKQPTPKEAFEECYFSHCVQGNVGLPLEQCIENCSKLTVLHTTSDTAAPGSAEGDTKKELTFDEVDFDCFKICRKGGDSMESCKAACVKY